VRSGERDVFCKLRGKPKLIDFSWRNRDFREVLRALLPSYFIRGDGNTTETFYKNKAMWMGRRERDCGEGGEDNRDENGITIML
jgi:hypothetical protein